MDFGGLVVRWAGLGYAVAHPDHPLSTPLAEHDSLWDPQNCLCYLLSHLCQAYDHVFDTPRATYVQCV
jgi:hypothetical protein